MTSTEQPRFRRMPPEERRQEIVAAAARVALVGGLEAVTYRSVAEELGCARGLVHHYFGSVESLEVEAFTAAVATDLQNCFQRAEEQPGAVAALAHLLGHWVSEDPEPHKTLWLDAWCQAIRKPGMRQAVDQAMHASHDRLLGLLQRGADAGDFTHPDLAALAWQLLTALDGLIVHSSIGVNRGIVDVRATITRSAEESLGLKAGALTLKVIP
ncbi:TetR family transcriptional regulator C-terminal domain-containing protein [Streptomyces sp. NPDC001904]|uniref:TetR/AcrR family transcriptional regulator n=1 Tax=Streptomyces sp. NPDC001904 TaxID=3154531 RepID=UPI003321FEF5